MTRERTLSATGEQRRDLLVGQAGAAVPSIPTVVSAATSALTTASSVACTTAS